MRKKLPLVAVGFVLMMLWMLSAQAFSQTIIKADRLQEDFAIAEKALTALHPGLYRYSDPQAMGRHFEELQQSLRKDLTLTEAYLAFSVFLARIKCGHTYANFWNQPDPIKQEVFGRADKVPFTFRLIGQRMIVTKTVSDDRRLRPGIEILAIDGVSTAAILDRLVKLVKGDGSNDGKRLYDLQLEGAGEFEAFDIYFPLIYPPKQGQYRIDALDPKTRRKFRLSVNAITRAQRVNLIEQRYGRQPNRYDDLWQFKLLDERTGYLQLGTFVTWQMKLDWKSFLRDSFRQLAEKKIPNLIIDIRGNEGGSDDVLLHLRPYLLWKPARLAATQARLRYERIPPELDPYLDTWDKSFRNREGQVKELGGGFYTWKNTEPRDTEFAVSGNAYQGKIYLLVNSANSSATYYLASFLKQNGLATLVGQETGGNRRGLTGSQMFFLRLPNSKIEIDIPLIGTYPLGPQPDQGLLPDVYVKPSVEDVARGIDAEMEVVKRLIAASPR